ncbi:hypothetical protein Hypma_012352 [Hypsizygus marmoreus]|uniref:CAP-Gly domain-containing protein n=1 Tax=Hypsizygus marmoreus TaxID=39966 RepID=A0A369K6D3_HYPMA|nr:hypothetical protein Hypma_012352 [Hypsizygus marmoreus]
MSTTTNIVSPALQEATKNSTTVWRQDLEALFHHAKDRFPDVVWEVGAGEDDEDDGKIEEVWGHKAIVYARAPPSFQTRYLSFRPAPYASSPLPTTSALSLDIAPSVSRTPSPFRSSSPASTAVQPPNTLLRLSTSINPALFSNELEYLYTGQGFGEAFEFLFDSSETPHDELDAEEMRIDKLRKDLVFMWRSRLYSDVRIALTGNFSTNHENTTAIFSSHRFILVSRSPYFHTLLIAWPSKSSDSQILTLPSPPFTPASLHFTLGFLYTGTLIFSHRSYDLDTGFHIMRSATYLSLPTLYDEIQARIVQEMLHGLFHAFLPFPEYEHLTSGVWGTGGCRCRQCARRAPRVLEFSLMDDVKNSLLERGARRALVGLYGEGWCTSEFAALPHKLRESLLKGVGKRTTPVNAFSLLFAAEHAMGRLGAIIDPWADEVREMVLVGRRGVDEIICGQPEACFAGREWGEIMERDGVAFEDGERVEWIMAAVGRGVNEKNAAGLYQTLVSSILLRPHPTETNAPMLSSTSHIRVQVEQARVDLLKWIGKRWLGIRQEGGFDDLEGWALKEISDNIEVPLEDLITPAPTKSHQTQPRQSTLLRAKDESDSISMHSSMRVSVLSRNLPVTSPTTTRRGGVSPSSMTPSSPAPSFKSVRSRSGVNGVHGASGSRERIPDIEEKDVVLDNSRPDSKLTPDLSSVGLPAYSSGSASPTPQPSIIEPRDVSDAGDGDEDDDRESMLDDHMPSTSASISLDHNVIQTTPRKIVVKKVTPTSRRPGPPGGPAGGTRPVSSASSIRSSAPSVRSHVSTIRKSTLTEASSNRPRPPPLPQHKPSSRASTSSSQSTYLSTPSSNTPRPTSTLSTTSTTSTTTASESSTAFRTAPSTVVPSSRSRRASAASTISNVSVRTGGRETPTRTTVKASGARTRKTSASSTKSSVSVTSTRRPPLPDTHKLSPSTAAKRPPSIAASVKSTVSSAASSRKTGGVKKVVEKGKEPAVGKPEKETKVPITVPDVLESPMEDVEATTTRGVEEPLSNTSSAITIKAKSRFATTALDHKKSGSTTSTGSTSTLKRKGSADTITTKASGTSRKAASNAGSAKSTTTPAAKSIITPTTAKSAKENQPLPQLPLAARGAMLEIGIPCIISSKRKRFKAYARYIGEVEGEDGPWVGVEVPSTSGAGGEVWEADPERQWNDGTWGGIRYFEIGSTGAGGSEWEFGAGEDRAARRRRLDWVGGGSGSYGVGAASTFGAGVSKGLKREGDQLSVDRVKRFRSVSPAVSDMSGMESRGLFVRPQQVLYVVDAVGSDF